MYRPLNRVLTVLGNNAFSRLQSRTPFNHAVIFKNCMDIPSTALPTFPFASKILFKDCDRNFVYYWLSPWRFPSLKAVYLLNTDAFSGEVLNRFQFKKVVLYIEEDYLYRWGPHYKSDVRVMHVNEMEKHFSQI